MYVSHVRGLHVFYVRCIREVLEELGEPTHTLVPCWMPRPLPPRNQCAGCFAPAVLEGHFHAHALTTVVTMDQGKAGLKRVLIFGPTHLPKQHLCRGQTTRNTHT